LKEANSVPSPRADDKAKEHEMKMMTGGSLVLAMLFATGVTGITAQEGRRGARMGGKQGQQEGGVESIMRLRESLELSEDQVSQLDAIRRENVQQRTAEMARTTEVQSQYAAGLIQRSDVMAAMEERQEAARGRDGQQRERLQSILTEGQQESLNDLRRQNRTSAGRGRAARERAGPGFRSDRRSQQGRGAFRGNRGGQQGSGAFRGNRGGPQGSGAFRGNRGGQQGSRAFRSDPGGRQGRGAFRRNRGG
jgi:hypothetical protein